MNSQSNALRDRLVTIVTRVLGPTATVPEPFPADLPLSQIGVSSLKMVNLMLAVEAEFDIVIAQGDITPENFSSMASIESLVQRTLQQAKSA